MRLPVLTRAAGLAAMLLGTAGAAHAAGDTEWLVAPYLWYPDISLDQSSGGGGGGISASDLLSKTDAAGMIRVEVARNRWGLSVDYLYLSVADNRNVTIPLPPNPTLGVRADLDLTVFEFTGVEHNDAVTAANEIALQNPAVSEFQRIGEQGARRQHGNQENCESFHFLSFFGFRGIAQI